MAILVTCNACGVRLRFKGKHSGKSTKCRACRAPLMVKGESVPDHDVFVSHSSKDKTVADQVVASLEAAHIRCWVAPRDILPGKPWAGAILDAIGDAPLMLLIYSANANSSPQVLREVDRAVSREVTIVPFRIEHAPPSKELEYYIAAADWLDAVDGPIGPHLQELTERIRALLAGNAPGDRGRNSRSRLQWEWVASLSAIALILVAAGLFTWWQLGRKQPATPVAAAASTPTVSVSPTPASAPAPLDPAAMKARMIAHLLSVAKANDSLERGRDALVALDELLMIEPNHPEATTLHARIASYYAPKPPAPTTAPAPPPPATRPAQPNSPATQRTADPADEDRAKLIVNLISQRVLGQNPAYVAALAGMKTMRSDRYAATNVYQLRERELNDYGVRIDQNLDQSLLSDLNPGLLYRESFGAAWQKAIGDAQSSVDAQYRTWLARGGGTPRKGTLGVGVFRVYLEDNSADQAAFAFDAADGITFQNGKTWSSTIQVNDGRFLVVLSDPASAAWRGVGAKPNATTFKLGALHHATTAVECPLVWSQTNGAGTVVLRRMDPKNESSLRIVLKAEEGLDVTDAVLSMGVNGPTTRLGPISREGQTIFSGLAPGQYKVAASGGSWATTSQSVTLSASGQQTVRLDAFADRIVEFQIYYRGALSRIYKQMPGACRTGESFTPRGFVTENHGPIFTLGPWSEQGGVIRNCNWELLPISDFDARSPFSNYPTRADITKTGDVEFPMKAGDAFAVFPLPRGSQARAQQAVVVIKSIRLKLTSR